jgi:hypothetical protein
LNNIRIYYKGGGTKERAARMPPEDANAYPEPRMFGEMPAHGFYLRYVNGIELKDVECGTSPKIKDRLSFFRTSPKPNSTM